MEMLSQSASGLRHLRWGREVVASLEAHSDHNPRLSPAEREALREEALLLRELVQRLSGAVKPYRDFLERTRVAFRARQRVGSFLCEQARRDLTARLRAAGGEPKRALLSSLDIGMNIEIGINKSPLESPASPLAQHQRRVDLAEQTAAQLRALPAEFTDLRELAGEHEAAAAILRAHNEAFLRMEEEQRRPLKTAVRGAVDDLRGGLARMNERLSERLGDAFVEALYPDLTRSGAMIADESDEDDDASAPS